MGLKDYYFNPFQLCAAFHIKIIHLIFDGNLPPNSIYLKNQQKYLRNGSELPKAENKDFSLSYILS